MDSYSVGFKVVVEAESEEEAYKEAVEAMRDGPGGYLHSIEQVDE